MKKTICQLTPVHSGMLVSRQDFATLSFQPPFRRLEYEAIGVREYVIVDRFKRQALVLTLGAQGFSERVLCETDAYTSPLLPGLSVRLAEVFSA